MVFISCEKQTEMIVLVTKPCFLKPWRGPVRGFEGQLWKVFHRRLQPWRPHGLCSQLPVLLKTYLGITQEKVSAFYIHNASLASLDSAHFGLSPRKGVHNSPIYDECQTQKAKVLTLPWIWAHQDNSNDTPQSMGECQVIFPLLRIRINQDKP